MDVIFARDFCQWYPAIERHGKKSMIREQNVFLEHIVFIGLQS